MCRINRKPNPQPTGTAPAPHAANPSPWSAAPSTQPATKDLGSEPCRHRARPSSPLKPQRPMGDCETHWSELQPEESGHPAPMLSDVTTGPQNKQSSEH